MKTKRFLSLAAIFAIALAFFACSSDDPSPPPSEPSSNSSEKVSCKLTSGACSQMSLSTCMELVNAGEAQIVPNCNAEPPPPPSSSSSVTPTPPPSSSSVALPPPSSSSTSSSSKIVSYCDYGPLVTQATGEVTGGCPPMGTADDEANCALWGNVVSSCPVTSGIFTDSRDSKPYKWVKIGTQTWMAENLNYNTTNSLCSDCTIYGRLYDWTTAKTVCPSGWHLPSDAEWTVLVNYVDGGSSKGATKLKAKSGWDDNKNGTDDYGFSALPGGIGKWGSPEEVGSYGNWWTATTATDDANSAYSRYMYPRTPETGGRETVEKNKEDKNDKSLSVRCLKN